MSGGEHETFQSHQLPAHINSVVFQDFGSLLFERLSRALVALNQKSSSFFFREKNIQQPAGQIRKTVVRQKSYL